MPRLVLSFLLLTVVSGSILSAQTSFTAASNAQVNNVGNWDNGLPSLSNPGTIAIDGVINSGLSDWIIHQTGGAVTSSFNRSFANVTWNLHGGSIAFTGANWLAGTGGHTLNIYGGSFGAQSLQLTNASTLNIADGEVNVASTSSNTGTIVNISSGSLTTSGNLTLTLATVTLTGGTVNVGGSFITNAANITFGLGNASLTTPTIGTTGATVINFLSGSLGTLTIGNFGAAEFEGLWDANNLRLDGARLGQFSDAFTVQGNTLSVIPEPSAVAAFLAGGALVLLARRRRFGQRN